jgi:Concanavalin A-like lectin/glucanases superfamily
MKPEDLQYISKERYFDQQLLRVEDFQREQAFHIASRELLTRFLYSPGILLGLNVALDKTNGKLQISPGFAIDSLGRQIILVSGASFENSDVALVSGVFTLDLTDKKYQNKKWLLTIEYFEETASPTETQWKEYPQLSLINAASKPSATQISLATIDVKVSGTTEKPEIDYMLDTSVQVAAALAASQNISADQITSGTLDAARIPNLPADKITSGTLDAALIPNIDFSKITGNIDAAKIPNFDADKIASGTINVERIPELSADKINSGVLKIEQIPDITADKLKGSLAEAQIPALKTDQITSGTFVIERIPKIPAENISGRLDISQLPETLPQEDSLIIEVDKPNINGEETVTLDWKDTSADEVHLEYIDEDQIVEKIWKAVEGIAQGWSLTPYQTSVYTVKAYKASQLLAQGQFTIQVIPNSFQYLKSMYFLGVTLADALQVCVNRYRLLPLTKEAMQDLAGAAKRANYSSDEALNILKTYPQKISELATPVINSFTNDKNNFLIQWNPVPNAESYELEFDDETGPKLFKPGGGEKEFTYTSPSKPAPGNYSVHIRAVAGDVYSQWSDTASLNIPEPKASQHHWAFDESDGTTAIDSVGKVNGTLSASVTRESPGCVGSGAVHINGNDDSYVTFGTKIGQFKTDDFTVALWFKTTETIRYFDVVGNRTDGSHGNFFCLRMTGQHESEPWGMLVAEVDQDGGGTNYTAVNSSRAGLNDGNWHHAAVVRSGTSLKIYVDGAFSAESIGSGVASISNGNDFKLGRSLIGFGDRFAPNASYDELWVYDSALSGNEISNLFKAKADDSGKDDGGKKLFFNGQAFGEMNYFDPDYRNNTEPNTLTNPINNGFTIEAMVYMTVEELNALPILSAFLPDGSPYLKDGPSFCLAVNAGKPSFLMTTYSWNNGSPSSPVISRLDADKKLPLNRWTHLAVTHDYQGTVIIYLNGVAVANTYFGTSMPNFSTYLLGKLDNSLFKGFIREVRLWRGAKSAEQIQKYSNVLLGNQAQSLILEGLGAYYQLTEGDGAVAKDSIKKNDFKLTNTSWTEVPKT